MTSALSSPNCRRTSSAAATRRGAFPETPERVRHLALGNLADQFHGDFRDRIDHSGKGAHSEERPHLVAGFSRGGGFKAVIEDDATALAGNDLEQFHGFSVFG
jgi:hypothetical protein